MTHSELRHESFWGPGLSVFQKLFESKLHSWTMTHNVCVTQKWQDSEPGPLGTGEMDPAHSVYTHRPQKSIVGGNKNRCDARVIPDMVYVNM